MPNFEASLEIVNCVIRNGRERIEQLTVRNAELEAHSAQLEEDQVSLRLLSASQREALEEHITKLAREKSLVKALTARNAELEVKQAEANSASEELKLADARLKWLQSLLERAGMLAIYRAQPK